MKNSKRIGIYLDHSQAHIYKFDSNTSTEINSDFTHEDKEKGLQHSEKKMHIKEQHQQHEFFSKLESEIKDYDSVLLFGPTDAKKEFSNILNENARFSVVKIHLAATDQLTEKQQVAFVNKYFRKELKN